MAAEAERLARVEARLHPLEMPTTSAYDVVVKTVAEQWVLATSVEVADFDAIGAAHATGWPRLHAALDDLGTEFVAPSIAVERGSGPIRLTFALPVPDHLALDPARTDPARNDPPRNDPQKKDPARNGPTTTDPTTTDPTTNGPTTNDPTANAVAHPDPTPIITTTLPGLDRAASTVVRASLPACRGVRALERWAADTAEVRTGELRRGTSTATARATPGSPSSSSDSHHPDPPTLTRPG
jgi:hypothetical protein